MTLCDLTWKVLGIALHRLVEVSYVKFEQCVSLRLSKLTDERIGGYDLQTRLSILFVRSLMS
jgi:hypothetical protein